MIKKDSSQKLNPTRKIVCEQRENPSLSAEKVFDNMPKSVTHIPIKMESQGFKGGLND